MYIYTAISTSADQAQSTVPTGGEGVGEREGGRRGGREEGREGGGGEGGREVVVAVVGVLFVVGHICSFCTFLIL